MPDPRRLDRTAAKVAAAASGPMVWTAVRDLGITEGQWRAAVAGGHLRVLRRGIAIPEATWVAGTDLDRYRWLVEAALLSFPRAWASHESAAALQGLPTFSAGELRASVHITRPGAARREPGLVVHGCDAPSGRVIDRDGILMTDPVRTTIELASTRSLRRSVAFIDAGMRLAVAASSPLTDIRGRVLDPVTRRQVQAEWMTTLAHYKGHRWVTRVRTAIQWADPGAETVLESLSRAEILQSGLPRPRCGVPVLGDDGRMYFADMLWDDARVIGEADGLGKYSDVDVVVREKRRQEALEAAGWIVVRWGWNEGVTHPDIMIGRLSQALRARRRPAS